jgi:hypothetical protein
MIQNQNFAQGNPLWGNIVIGQGTNPDGSTYNLTMAGFGCDICSLASTLWAFEINTDPGKLYTALKAEGGIAPDGEINNDVVTKVYPDVVFGGSLETVLNPAVSEGKITMDEAALHIQRLLNIGIPVIIQVDAWKNDKVKSPNHFVEVVDWNNGDPLIIDPIFGEVMPLSKNYGTPETAIFGLRIWIGSPITVPTNGDLQAGIAAWKIAMAIKNIKTNNLPLALQYAKEALDGFTQ